MNLASRFTFLIEHIFHLVALEIMYDSSYYIFFKILPTISSNNINSNKSDVNNVFIL